MLDEVDTGPVPLDPAALRERKFLAGCDYVQAVCWLGARLAEALAHAHDNGILHRDVKPANVLLNRFGRPFLADFNLSFAGRSEGADETPFGGTLAYMAPEHLEAFAPAGKRLRAGVNGGSDLYALGVVLYELLTCRLPFRSGPRPGLRKGDQLLELAAERRAGAPPLPCDSDTPPALVCVVRRCLDPDPERRFRSAGDLAAALDGCGELCRVRKALPTAGPLAHGLCLWPFALGCALVLLPHVLGSVVNVSYNVLRIVGHLNAEQQAAFHRLVKIYNALVYPVGVVWMAALVLPVRRTWQRLNGADPPSDELSRGDPPGGAAVTHVVRRAVGARLAAGWTTFPARPRPPGRADRRRRLPPLPDLVHNLGRHRPDLLLLRNPVHRAAQVLYPSLWGDTRQFRATVRNELAGIERRLAAFQLLAVLIPLSAAVLMVAVGPEDFREGYRPFRILVTTLIALGMTGLGVAMAVSRRLRETLAAMTGGESR